MVYQWYDSEKKPKIVEDCINQVKSVVGDRHAMVPVEHKEFERQSNARSESDLLRCYLLAKDPNGQWIDTDDEIVSEFVPPKNGKPYFTQGIMGRANGDVIISNGNTGFFEEVIKMYEGLSEAQRNPGWLQKILNTSMKDRIGLIPMGHYRHLALCHTDHLMEGQVIGIGDVAMKKINGELVIISRD